MQLRTPNPPPVADASRSNGVVPHGSGSRPRGAGRWGEALAGFAARNTRAIGVTWVLLLIVCGLLSLSLMNSLSSEGWDLPGSSAVKARSELTHGFVGRGKTTVLLAVTDRDYTAAAPAFTTRIQQVYNAALADRSAEVASAYGWSTVSGAYRADFLGKDQRTVVTSLGLRLNDNTATKTLPTVQKELSNRFGRQGLSVSLLSIQAFQGEANKESVTGLVKGEAIAFPLVALVLLLLFGSVVAVIAAMATAMSTVTLTLGIFGPIAQHAELSIFLENIVLMLGLGLGIDYSLIIIKRFKEEIAAGREVEDALRRTLRTAGAAVIASGMTVIVVSSTLFIVRLDAIVSLAAGAAVVAAVALFSAVVLLPALLYFLGERINSGRVWLPQRLRMSEAVGEEQLVNGRWYRLAMNVMDRPVLCLAASAAVLLLLAIPAFSMKLLLPDTRILPANSAVRSGTDTVAKQFGTGYSNPIQVVVTVPAPLPGGATDAQLRTFVSEVSRLPDVGSVNSALPILQQASPRDPWAALKLPLPPDARAGVGHFISSDGRRFVVEVVSTHTLTDNATISLLDRVSALAAKLPAPLHAAVGGDTSRQVDVTREINSKIGWVFAMMLAAIYVVLLLSFESVLLPLKAIAVNVLSFGATFGVLVMVFQYGWAPGFLGLNDLGYQIAFVPLLVAAIVAALSTDYEVFLLSRVREEYLETGDNRVAVARGLAQTAPLITGAALLMVVVFSAFGLAGVVGIQELGIGLAVAVAIDASLIRVIVVPAAMRLMGRWNWWRPGAQPHVARQPLVTPSSADSAS